MRMMETVTDALPLASMVLLEFGDVGVVTLTKAAMTSGMSNFVYVVYYNSLGTLILLPYFIFHRYRSKGPPLTFSLLARFFFLGLVGICLVPILSVMGIKSSSPILVSAIANLIPVFTFLLAIIFRMEIFDPKSRIFQAKSLGTIVSITGAFIVTFYKGPLILKVSSPSNSLQVSAQESNWVLGGLLITITSLASAAWKIAQAATTKEYTDNVTLVFCYIFFGTIQCASISVIAERNLSAWTLHPGIQMLVIVYAAVYACAIRNSILTWCLQKKGPLFVALFKPLGTAMAVMMGVMFLGETLHIGSLIGAIVIALGFYTVMWGQVKERETAADRASSLESSTQKAPLLQNENT